MSTVMTWQTESISSAVTEQLGERLGQRLKGGEVIELVSDLGGGKTTFVRGLARGIGSSDHVSSPTFKISNIYKSNKLELHHFDFYRLNEAGVIANELVEIVGQPGIAVVIEWSAVVRDVLPKKRLTIQLSTTDDHSRNLEFSYPTALSYLIENL